MVKNIKTFLLQNRKSFDLKPWLQHRELELYNVFIINDYTGLTVAYFTDWLNLVAYTGTFDWRKTVRKSFNGKTLQQMTTLTVYMYLKC